MRRRLVIITCLLAILCSASVVEAGRLHVRVDGLRTIGPSQPDDWSYANCYANLAEAAAAASPADSLLLYTEEHALSSEINVTGYLGNMRLDADYQDTDLQLTGVARLRSRRWSAAMMS